MFNIFKATAITSIATVSTMLVGVIRAKFTAVSLGPSGVGIFSQAFNFNQLAITVSSLGIGLGIAKYVAYYLSQKDSLSAKGVIVSAFTMQLAVALPLVLAVSVFSGFLSQLVFSTREYRLYLVVLVAGMLFSVFAGTLEAVLFGFGNYRSFAKGRSVSSFISLLPLFVFISLMGIPGGFIYLAISSFLTFLVYGYLFFRSAPKELLAEMRTLSDMVPRREMLLRSAKELLSYGGVSFVTGILGLINVVFLRSLLIKYMGAAANGYYQVVFTLSAYYLAFFTNGIWSYLYAKLSSFSRDVDRYSVELNHAMRFCVFGIVPSVAVLYLSRNFIIRLVFSDKFLEGSALFSTQLFGDLFFILFYILGTSLLASTRLRAYLGFMCLYSTVLIGTFLGMRGFLGLQAITVSYLVSNLVLLSAVLYYHIRVMRIMISVRNTALFISGVFICAVTFFVGTDNAAALVLKLLLVLIWLAVLSKPSERKRVWTTGFKRVQALFGADHA